MNRRNYFQLIVALFAASVLGSCTATSKSDTCVNQTAEIAAKQTFDIPEIPKGSTVFYLVNDLGRNGYYEQKTIAELMGNMGEEVGPDFIVAAGDTHHFDGVASVNDPLWMTNYELIYSHPELMLDWYAINGNHEYRGNTQAVLDYSDVSRRWNAENYYYTKTIEAGDNEKALLVFIDTTPLIDKYRKESDKYPDASKKAIEEQLKWLDKTLAASNEKWKIVIGHHPIHAFTPKEESERTDLQARVQPLLDKYGVDMYLCGHIHNFQHIQPANSKVDYLVNSSGSLSRKVQPIDGTQFCSSEAGFTIFSVTEKEVTFYLINGKGKILYSYTRAKA